VTGEEIPLGDLQAYANAIDSLLSHPDKMKQYAEASRQRVLDMFTDEKAVWQMNKLYHQL
jgi:glycosyltransferase involved in cell wall biosynthesis